MTFSTDPALLASMPRLLLVGVLPTVAAFPCRHVTAADVAARSVFDCPRDPVECIADPQLPEAQQAVLQAAMKFWTAVAGELCGHSPRCDPPRDTPMATAWLADHRDLVAEIYDVPTSAVADVDAGFAAHNDRITTAVEDLRARFTETGHSIPTAPPPTRSTR